MTDDPFTNETRAHRFEVAMVTLDGVYEYDLPTVLIDLLADARHWCDRAGLSFAALDRTAYDHYLTERHNQPGDEQ